MFSNSDEFQIVSGSTLDEMAAKGVQSERKRVHLLLHDGHDDQVQRLIIVTQPGIYVRPCCHPEQCEMLILLQGRGDLLRFEPDGQIADRAGMSAAAPVAQIPQVSDIASAGGARHRHGEARPVSVVTICRPKVTWGR
jgi:cupin fold WbuC family metalloprotein